MAGVVPPRLLKIDRTSIVTAAEVVSKGGLVVFPTDTVYGLGCDPFDARAVARLFEAKGRSAKPVPVLCSDESKAAELVDLGGAAGALAKRHWPGALTIVAPLKRDLPPALHQGSGSLGVRVPRGELCIALLRECGGWLTGTSANRSGGPSSRTVDHAVSQLDGRADLFLDGGILNGEESTVVKFFGDSMVVLRQGRVGVTDAMKQA